MNQEILDYIKSQRVCVVALEMLDGSPHAATVHFAHQDDPLVFVIQTSPGYRKLESLLGKENTRASLVVGTEEHPEKKDKTFQLDGVAQIIDSDSDLAQLYREKFPDKSEKYANDIFFTVTPTWWRFTDWSKPEGKTIYTSDGTVTVNGKTAKE